MDDPPTLPLDILQHVIPHIKCRATARSVMATCRVFKRQAAKRAKALPDACLFVPTGLYKKPRAQKWLAEQLASLNHVTLVFREAPPEKRTLLSSDLLHNVSYVKDLLGGLIGLKIAAVYLTTKASRQFVQGRNYVCFLTEKELQALSSGFILHGFGPLADKANKRRLQGPEASLILKRRPDWAFFDAFWFEGQEALGQEA